MLRLIGLGWFSRSGVVWCGGSGGVTVRAHDAGGELDVGFVLHLSIWADYMCVVVNFFFLGSPLFLPSKYNRSLIRAKVAPRVVFHFLED